MATRRITGSMQTLLEQAVGDGDQPVFLAQSGGTGKGAQRAQQNSSSCRLLSGSRWHGGSTGSASVLTSAMRGGDFFRQPTGFAKPIQLYDPLNNFAPYTKRPERAHQQPGSEVSFRQSQSLSQPPNAPPTDGARRTTTRPPRAASKLKIIQ